MTLAPPSSSFRCVGQDARDGVGAAAGREADQDAHGARGLGLRGTEGRQARQRRNRLRSSFGGLKAEVLMAAAPTACGGAVGRRRQAYRQPSQASVEQGLSCGLPGRLAYAPAATWG